MASSATWLSEAQAFLERVKTTFLTRPLVYECMVRNLNRFAQLSTADEQTAVRLRVEALLASDPELLRGFRAFLPAASAAPPVALGTGRGKSRDDAISFDSDEEAAPAAPAKDEADEDDDEVVITGASGSNALSEFPHPRHACVVHPLPGPGGDRATARLHCPRCYCFLCDGPAAECASWAEHSIARDDANWLAVRSALRAAPTPPRNARPRPEASAARRAPKRARLIPR